MIGVHNRDAAIIAAMIMNGIDIALPFDSIPDSSRRPLRSLWSGSLSESGLEESIEGYVVARPFSKTSGHHVGRCPYDGTITSETGA